ncbi:hypothetical protein [Archangium violaceum]|uniref:Uncharacterized protein n=1 Tax=Archangium violaceum Cb vi76 TaxID=1406225 RepID=A0A084SE63_9BACT|nr:hypothetical protein [Archangium violaceum]KFA86748.1 hypothetical protein Q664_52375 [Archangium violaceum Cb vi76]
MKRGWSARGTPSISAITLRGSGTEKSSASSISPRERVRSNNSWDSARMRGSRLATARGVKARMMRARSFVWRGGSMKTSHWDVIADGGATTELNASWSWSARFTLS